MAARHRLFALVLLPLLMMALTVPALGAAKKKKKSIKVKLHPAISARFRISPKLSPTREQKKQASIVRTKRGPMLQLLTQRIAFLERMKQQLNSRRGSVDAASPAQYAGLKIPGLGVNSRNFQRKEIAAKKKYVDTLLSQYGTAKTKLEAEIRTDFNKILTDDQKAELAKLEAAWAAKIKAAKEAAAKFKKK